MRCYRVHEPKRPPIDGKARKCKKWPSVGITAEVVLCTCDELVELLDSLVAGKPPHVRA